MRHGRLEACGFSVAPHNPLGPIATAATIHFALVTPNWLIQEAIRSDVPWRNEVVGGELPVEHGYISLPTTPGLGIEVEAAKHPFEQEVLMQWWHPDGAVAEGSRPQWASQQQPYPGTLVQYLFEEYNHP